MRKFAKPKIVIRKCIEFANCRYNGDMIHSQAAADLKEFAEFIPVCPEVEIGMTIPRPSVRIIEDGEGRRLVSSTTGEDFSERMGDFGEKFMKMLGEGVDGFLMKTSSPSCGYKDSKVYPNAGKGSSTRKNSSGFFSEQIEKFYPDITVETEGRLDNFSIREEYYTKLFMAAQFREITADLKIKNLVEFHSDNKYLMMTYSPKHLKILGNITANRENEDEEVIFKKYKKEFLELLKKNRKTGTNINVMMHIMGYFSDQLTKEEKEFILEKFEHYQNSMIPLSVPLTILEGWVVRFGDEYLKRQTIFTPFPKTLISVTDSGKGREK